ncbi:MAG TPA: hypothetical protein VKL40_08735 [Candidatus Angelobacter sp.]|nr:hypothetical protein [Candidatus Angelobacter sp.]
MCNLPAELEGGDHLERVRWRNIQTGQVETRDISHMFVMTGAVPNTRWLDGCMALETSLPGVFAVGDIRGGSVKRVAFAVGKGSIAISFVHQVLSE